MLTIRLQRTGRRGHAQYRLVVQDSRFSPTSGRVVTYVGSYNPHTKESQVDAEAIKKYLANGAQPSPRVISLLKDNKITVPKWSAKPSDKKRSVRNPEKRRSTAPAQPESPITEEASAEAPANEEPVAEAAQTEDETPAEAPAGSESSEANTEETAKEGPAESAEAAAEEQSAASEEQAS